MHNQPKRASLLARVVRFFITRFFPAILAVVFTWTMVQVVVVATRQNSRSTDAASRSTAYQATATALAASADSSQNVMQFIAQFVTNTPESVPTVVPTESLPTAIPVVPTASVNTIATPYVAPTFFPPSASDLVSIAGTAVPTPVPLIPRDYELVNIMLLGGDDELSTDGTIRTDTMIVVSINTQTRTVSMLSLPRDLFVYVPTPTMTRLNTVYGIGESFGWQGGGWELLRETIFYNFGINVHYFAKVDFTGFETIIDTLGGVDIAVDCTYEDYYPNAVIDPTLPVEQNYSLRTLDVGYYTFDGFDALWYARTRRVADDFDRGRRQQQMLRAIFRAALREGLVASVPQLWGDITQVVQTNIPFDLVLGLLPIALEVDPANIANYTLTRTYHTLPWQPTEGPFQGQYVQLPVYEPIRQLLTEFYQPPTANQVATQLARIAVYNGTGIEGLDKVAVEKLRDAGILAVASGAAPAPIDASHIVDYVGDDKGSPLPTMLSGLGLPETSVERAPDPDRIQEYAITLGADYDSCTASVVDAATLNN